MQSPLWCNFYNLGAVFLFSFRMEQIFLVGHQCVLCGGTFFNIIKLLIAVREHGSFCRCRYSGAAVFCHCSVSYSCYLKHSWLTFRNVFLLSCWFGNIPAHKVVCWCEEGVNIMAENSLWGLTFKQIKLIHQIVRGWLWKWSLDFSVINATWKT